MRVDQEDKALLDREAHRLGVRSGTLARMLLRAALRPSDRTLLQPLGPATPPSQVSPLNDRHMRDQVIKAAERHGASNVRVFGSAARGEATTKSDLDLLVQMDEGRSLLDVVALTEELEELLGRDVDVVTDGGVSPHLRERIYAEAVPL